MKAPAFQLYPQDFISSLDVQLMSAAEVGAYCLLLFNSWTQPRQGFLPNDEAQLRHLSRLSAEEWKTSKKRLLAKFPATEDKKHRYNPRLLVEAGKQATFREKQAEHGKRGGRPRQDEKPDKANPFLGESQNNPTLSQPVGKPKPARAHSSSSSSTSSSKSKSNDLQAPASPADLTSSLQAEKPNDSRGAAEVLADEATVFTIAGFRAFVNTIGFARIDVGFYLPQIQYEAGKQAARPNDGPGRTWEAFVKFYLNNERKYDRLTYPAPASPSGSYAGPNPALQVTTSTSYSPAAIAARNVTKY